MYYAICYIILTVIDKIIQYLYIDIVLSTIASLSVVVLINEVHINAVA